MCQAYFKSVLHTFQHMISILDLRLWVIESHVITFFLSTLKLPMFLPANVALRKLEKVFHISEHRKCIETKKGLIKKRI
ncbi:hypothetical protein [Sideroxydans sp. CL21]|nr:hypothetical protein [Sideroxydans sp. CL21]